MDIQKFPFVSLIFFYLLKNVSANTVKELLKLFRRLQYSDDDYCYYHSFFPFFSLHVVCLFLYLIYRIRYTILFFYKWLEQDLYFKNTYLNVFRTTNISCAWHTHTRNHLKHSEITREIINFRNTYNLQGRPEMYKYCCSNIGAKDTPFECACLATLTIFIHNSYFFQIWDNTLIQKIFSKDTYTIDIFF